MADPNILNFGGTQLDELYNQTGSRDQVFAYLQAVIDNHDTLNPRISNETRDELVNIRDQIALLRLYLPIWRSLPDGAEYLAGNDKKRTPKQHIRREYRTGWLGLKEQKNLQSKFGVLAANNQTWSVNDVARQYWNQYDLLGLFFSKMGPAPGGGFVATQRNFYLPLTAVYAKFCLWIGGNQAPSMQPETSRSGLGIGAPPQCFQMTWNADTGKFFLGAALAGYDFNACGAWEPELRGKRYHLLDNFFDFPGTWGTFEKGRSPVIAYELNGKTQFGNCGETYPFLEIIGPNVSNVDTRAKTRGVALGARFANVPEYQGSAYSSMLYPPCLNCQMLLGFAGIFDLDSFTADTSMTTPVFPPGFSPREQLLGGN